MRLLATALVLAFLPGLLGTTGGVRAADIVIGTGSPNGIYFKVGRAICRLIDNADAGMSCAPLATEGSQFNVSNLRAGAIELGVVQSDVHYQAYSKTGRFEFVDESYDHLRSLFSLHSEAFTVVARQDSGIRSFDELKGKRVNIGNPGSGQRATMDAVMAAKGWTVDDFLVVQELTAAEHVLALCHDRIQALVYTVGHPSASIEKAVGLCGGRMLDVGGAEIDGLLDSDPFYVRTRIPKDLYAASPDAVETFGVKATLLSTTDVDEETIYRIVKAVFDELDALRSFHPSFEPLEAEGMITEGLTAPLHEGAKRYFQERGMM